MSNYLTINQDSNLVFSNDEKVVIRTNNNLNITINSNVEIVLLTNKKIDINIIANRFSTTELTLITFNNKEITFTAELLEGSHLDSNFIVINKGNAMNIKQTIKHTGRDSYSMVNNKAIAFSKASIDFETVGTIRNGIKNCNCNQLTRGLILEENASIKALPILLIDECDVKAYHGATIGNVNDDDLFYLMSRGLNKKEAFNLVVNGLFKPYFEKIFIEKEQNEVLEKYNSFFK